jgi:hypothetical protein
MDERERISWTERRGGLLEPDVVLPAQYFRVLRGRASYGGERRLIIAVLEDAINCFQKNLFATDSRGRRLFCEAENWLMSTDRELPFAFENICEFLSLDAEYIRRGLRRWAYAVQSKAAQGFDSEGSAGGGAAAPVAGSAAMRPAMVAAEERAPELRRPTV